MRIECVEATSFGPLKAATLHFAPGMNVIWGRNESGKSSWHAALYAGLCGVRRGRGRSKKEREFETAHRPWAGDAWAVAVTLRLDSGRRVELRQNLGNLAACQATDLGLGRDVLDEVLHEGTPDGALWLGLDRYSFPLVACVRQAEILAVLAEPGELQEFMQRAAATAGGDATTAEALHLLDEFQKENVGKERRKAVKPLRRAMEARDKAHADLEAARRTYEELEDLAERAESAEARARESRRRLEVLEATQAEDAARRSRARMAEARALAARFPDGRPPALAGTEELAREVQAALSTWKNRPAPVELGGRSADDIREEMHRLPAVPDGDLAVAEEVESANREFERAVQAVELHGAAPKVPARSLPDEVSAAEVRHIAEELEIPVPRIDPALQARVEETNRCLDALPSSAATRATFALGIALAIAGAMLLALHWVFSGAVVLGAGVVALVWAVARGSGERRAQLTAELAAIREGHSRSLLECEQVVARRGRAEERARALGMATDPPALRRIATGLEEHEKLAARRCEWERRHEELTEQLDKIRRTLAIGLRAHGVVIDAGDVEAGFRGYQSACEERARLAREAERRGDLEAQLQAREAAEQQAGASAHARAAASDRLATVAERCDVGGGIEAETVECLEHWLAERREQVKAHQHRIEEWSRLETLLDGRSLADLERAAAELQARTREKMAGVDAAEVEARAAVGVSGEEIEQARREVLRAGDEASRLAGELARAEKELPPMAEVEEELARAERELQRVRRLDETLRKTREFLEAAEDRVHRDIAPVLEATLTEWLPRVTEGHYSEAKVDPQCLGVRVLAGGAWRDATLLSHGTAEQIYLLLRVALAQHLGVREESCPLILDDVTVQSDAARTVAILDTVRELSERHQVIVFSQEEGVRAWAERNLTGEGDRFLALPEPPGNWG